jgi:hypothetical protein
VLTTETPHGCWKTEADTEIVFNFWNYLCLIVKNGNTIYLYQSKNCFGIWGYYGCDYKLVTALWTVTPFSLVDMYQSSRRHCYLHYKGRRIIRVRKYEQGSDRERNDFHVGSTETTYQLSYYRHRAFFNKSQITHQRNALYVFTFYSSIPTYVSTLTGSSSRGL